MLVNQDKKSLKNALKCEKCVACVENLNDIFEVCDLSLTIYSHSLCTFEEITLFIVRPNSHETF